MTIRNLVREALLSLGAHKTRSVLTMLGIVIGIAAVIVMVALGNGTKASIEGSLESMGSNLIMVSPGQNSSPVPGAARSVSAQTLTLDDVEAIERDVPGVAAIAPQLQTSLSVVGDAGDAQMTVTGTWPSYSGVRNIDVASGAWFAQADEQGGARVVVLGATAATDLFGEGSDPVGRTIRVGGVPFQVVGVTEAKGGSGTDDAIYVPLSTMRVSLAGGDEVSMVHIQAVDERDMEAVSQEIEQVLLAAHDIEDPEDADFTVTSMKDLTSTMSSISGMLTGLLGSIASISLIVGGIGIMNMMLTSVTERTREIGLRKSLGARSADINAQFLLEAIALTVVGGCVGILFGVGVCAFVSASGVLPAVVTVQSVLLAAGVSTAVGVLFGYYPARNASKLDPIEALRYQ